MQLIPAEDQGGGSYHERCATLYLLGTSVNHA
jgi:hypothetical protein